jgi:hypothetical protein
LGRKGIYKPLVGTPKGKKLLGRPRINENIKLKYILKKCDRRTWSGLFWLRMRPSCRLLLLFMLRLSQGQAGETCKNSKKNYAYSDNILLSRN